MNWQTLRCAFIFSRICSITSFLSSTLFGFQILFRCLLDPSCSVLLSSSHFVLLKSSRCVLHSIWSYKNRLILSSIPFCNAHIHPDFVILHKLFLSCFSIITNCRSGIVLFCPSIHHPVLSWKNLDSYIYLFTNLTTFHIPSLQHFVFILFRPSNKFKVVLLFHLIYSQRNSPISSLVKLNFVNKN